MGISCPPGWEAKTTSYSPLEGGRERQKDHWFGEHMGSRSSVLLWFPAPGIVPNAWQALTKPGKERCFHRLEPGGWMFSSLYQQLHLWHSSHHKARTFTQPPKQSTPWGWGSFTWNCCSFQDYLVTSCSLRGTCLPPFLTFSQPPARKGDIILS